MIRAELRKLVLSRRTWVTIALLDALPTIVAILLAVTDLGPRPGTGPAFLSAVLSDGKLFPLAAIAIVLPLFLPGRRRGDGRGLDRRGGPGRHVALPADPPGRAGPGCWSPSWSRSSASSCWPSLVVAVTAYVVGPPAARQRRASRS